jgi:hypothetical protein
MKTSLMMIGASVRAAFRGYIQRRPRTSLTCTQAHDVQALTDVPEDFLDPLTYTLMHDPVVMPTSGTRIERAVILRHLMSDPRDPISRKPLLPEQLQDDLDLRAKIDAWKAEKHQQHGKK